jgi:hypothetical protein
MIAARGALMKMTVEKVGLAAGLLLSVLERHKLTSLDALRGLKGKVIGSKPGKPSAGEETIGVTFQAHPKDPAGVVVSYVYGDQPPLIMLILSDSFARILLTAEKPLDGYTVFDKDPAVGLMQDRKWPSIDQPVQTVLSELKSLSALAAQKP